MTHILIVYGTTDGHTAKVAQVLAENFRALRCCVDIVDAAGRRRRLSPEGYDGVIVAASVHIGDYQRAVGRWVRTHATTLNGIPTAFLSVCLAVLEQSATTRQEVVNIMERFFARHRLAAANCQAHRWCGALHPLRMAQTVDDETDRRKGRRQHGHDTRSRVHRLERSPQFCAGVHKAPGDRGADGRGRCANDPRHTNGFVTVGEVLQGGETQGAYSNLCPFLQARRHSPCGANSASSPLPRLSSAKSSPSASFSRRRAWLARSALPSGS